MRAASSGNESRTLAVDEAVELGEALGAGAHQRAGWCRTRGRRGSRAHRQDRVGDAAAVEGGVAPRAAAPMPSSSRAGGRLPTCTRSRRAPASRSGSIGRRRRSANALAIETSRLRVGSRSRPTRRRGRPRAWRTRPSAARRRAGASPPGSPRSAVPYCSRWRAYSAATSIMRSPRPTRYAAAASAPRSNASVLVVVERLDRGTVDGEEPPATVDAVDAVTRGVVELHARRPARGRRTRRARAGRTVNRRGRRCRRPPRRRAQGRRRPRSREQGPARQHARAPPAAGRDRPRCPRGPPRPRARACRTRPSRRGGPRAWRRGRRRRPTRRARAPAGIPWRAGRATPRRTASDRR